LHQELAQEQNRLRATQLAAARDAYLQALSHQVAQHWLRPSDVSSDLTCVVQVQQTKTGEVISAKVVRSSGNTFFDRSVEAAVLKASPLPTPPDPELFDPVLNVTFHADDLSL
jgi:colicin import membrane protein